MSTFLLQQTVIDQIDKFKKLCLWRGADINAKQKSKAAWPTVCRSRDEGGLRGERGWEREGETFRAPWIHRRRRRPASPRLTERRRARLAEPSAASAPRRRPASPRRAPPGRGGEGAHRRGERSGGRRSAGRSVGQGREICAARERRGRAGARERSVVRR